MYTLSSDRVPALTAVLSIVSLALVFGAVGGLVPEWLLPRVDGLVAAIPHINALLSIVAIVTIAAGIVTIRQGRVERHRNAMLTSTVVFALFLVLYLYRVSLEGPTAFPGPDVVRLYFYLPILAIHIFLAILCIPFVFYALLLAWAHPTAALPNTHHPRAGKIAAVLWLISFALGFTVYLLLYIVY